MFIAIKRTIQTGKGTKLEVWEKENEAKETENKRKQFVVEREEENERREANERGEGGQGG